MNEPAFKVDLEALMRSVELLGSNLATHEALPIEAPSTGLGPDAALDTMSALFLGSGRNLGSPGFFAHMDPPTPWITWAMQMWAARMNQNLLHPDTAPVARDLERRVIGWLAPLFGMDGGHMTPGSTIANLTAVWAAREAGATTVVSGPDAHVSVAKAAHLLGLTHRTVEDWRQPGPLDDAVVVLTAGTTGTGAIEPLDAAPNAVWRHVDAAWAGPLRLSDTHRHLLDGIDRADSVAVSAHKWLFQPKESAMVLFRDVRSAHESISFASTYLSVPNVGLLGSHGATALPLAATLLAYGTNGVSAWIDRCMDLADELWRLIVAAPELEARNPPQTGVVNWRHRGLGADTVIDRLAPPALVSATTIGGGRWLRSVAANPMASPQLVVDSVLAAAR